MFFDDILPGKFGSTFLFCLHIFPMGFDAVLYNSRRLIVFA